MASTVKSSDTERIANVIREAAQEVGPVRDPRPSGDPAESEKLEAAADAASERKLNEPSARERDLADQLAQLQEKIATYEKLHKKWVLGDYSDLPSDHPFEVLLYNDDNPWTDLVVTLTHNGHERSIVRGEPTRVPKYIVSLLDCAKVDALQQFVTPDGHAVRKHVLVHRFPFAAHPVY